MRMVDMVQRFCLEGMDDLNPSYIIMEASHLFPSGFVFLSHSRDLVS